MKKSSGKLAVVVACALIALASAAYGEASSKSDVPTPTGVESNGPAPLAVGDSAADLVYTPVAPCRIIDTRGAGGGPLAANTTRNFRVTGAATMASQGGSTTGCGVPSGATAAIINFVAVSPAGAGDLQAWPYSPSGVAPNASIINYAALPNLNIANAVSIKLCDPAAPPAGGCTSDFTIQADASAVEIVADVQGYFSSLALDQNFVGQAGSTMPIPAQGASTAAFDSGTVQPGADFKRKLVEITGMCSVSITAAVDGFDIEIANLSGATLGFSHTPIASDAGIPTGGVIAAGTAGHIAQTAGFVTRTIQISSETGEDVPVATLTLSGRRGAGGALRVTTQLLVANP